MSDQSVRYITVEKAAELLDKTTHSVRQLLQRGKLVKHKKGNNVFAILDDVLTYYARKKGVPSWEENIEEVKKHAFVSLFFTANALMVQQSYIYVLIRSNKLEGYITSSGDLMIRRDSVNDYLRTPDHDDTKDM